MRLILGIVLMAALPAAAQLSVASGQAGISADAALVDALVDRLIAEGEVIADQGDKIHHLAVELPCETQGCSRSEEAGLHEGPSSTRESRSYTSLDIISHQITTSGSEGRDEVWVFTLGIAGPVQGKIVSAEHDIFFETVVDGVRQIVPARTQVEIVKVDGGVLAPGSAAGQAFGRAMRDSLRLGAQVQL